MLFKNLMSLGGSSVSSMNKSVVGGGSNSGSNQSGNGLSCNGSSCTTTYCCDRNGNCSPCGGGCGSSGCGYYIIYYYDC